MFNEWPAAGIEHRIYNPHLFGRFGFSRTHRKLAVVDDQFAYCGGINIVDDYENNGEQLPYRRWDFAVEVQGPVVADVRQAFDVQWQRIRLGHRPQESLEPDLGPQTMASLGTLRRRRRNRNDGALGRRPAVRRVRRARQPDQSARDRKGVSDGDRPGAQRSAARQSVLHAGPQAAARAGVRGAARRRA